MSFKLSLAVTKESIHRSCGKITMPKNYESRYQINPGQKLNCILNTNPNRMYTLEWGLIPEWSKTLNNRATLTEINTDGAINKPSSRIPFRSKRGYALVDGLFYIRKKGMKYTPYRIQRKDGELMKIACLWDVWKSNDQYLSSVAILTQTVDNHIANSLPYELRDEKVEQWLHHEDINFLDSMINQPVHTDMYTTYKVSDCIFNKEKNDAQLYEQVYEELTLFSHL